MNLNISKNTVIALVVGAVLIVAAVYLLFFQSPSNAVVVESGPTSPEEMTFETRASCLWLIFTHRLWVSQGDVAIRLLHWA